MKPVKILLVVVLSLTKKTKRKPTLIPRQTVSPTVLGTKNLRVSFFYKDFISTNPPKAFMA